jgi:alkanesulfonate monooxygenase SsuD/methylene tetrahydromethanopterin reductase-like flavin-dependent oxidoreductase (luciferase family)
MTPRVGIMIEGQEGLTWDRWRRLARAVEAGGFDSLFRSDHLTGLFGDSKRPSLDAWASLTWLATATTRIRFGPLVCPLTFYHPALLAKRAAAVDHLSSGRLDLGLGAGWHEPEHRMYGLPFPSVRERGPPRHTRPALLPARRRRELSAAHPRAAVADHRRPW